MSNTLRSDPRTRYWQEQIQAWQRSGQTQRAFCQAHDLNLPRFGYWLRKFRQQRAVDTAPVRSGFVAVVEGVSATGLSLRLPSGLEVRGIGPDNVALVAQLIERLA